MPAALLRLRRPSKYHNRPTVVGNVRFDSAKEARRWQELHWLQQAGEISGLDRQVSFDLFGANGVKVAAYRADFVYLELKTMHLIIEDVKGVRTPLYKLKKRLLEAQGYAIREVD